MPQHKSAEKRLRQTERRTKHNKQYKSRVRTMMNRVKECDTKEEAEPLLNQAKGMLDRLAGKGIIHQNRANQYKSRLDKYVDSLS